MKKILVTGGLGFTGYHLIRHLFDYYEDPDITVADNLSSSKIEFGSLTGKFKAHVIDLKDFETDEQFEDIYHLASPVGSLGILQLNGYVAKEIMDLTYKVIQLALYSGAKLLYVSTSEVYGCDGLHKESTNLCVKPVFGTRSEYSLGKLTSEIILHNINICENINFNIVRPFNVIGGQQSSLIGFVVPTFFENALNYSDLPVFYDGTQKRSFCHVEDVVRAFVMIQESVHNHEIFNVGNDYNIISIKDLALEIKKITHSKSKITHLNPSDIYGKKYIEAFNKIPDITKIKNLINWKPEINLDNALNKIYKYYQGKDENIICKSGI